MNEQDKIVIEFSKFKSMRLIFFSFLFILGGIFLIYMRRPLYIIIGVICIAFFGFALLALIKKTFRKDPALILSKVGILDNASAVSISYEIPWQDIVKIENKSFFSQQFVVVHLKENEKYIDRVEDQKLKKIIETNMKMVGSPVAISANALSISHEKLYDIIKDSFEKYGGLN